MKKLTTAIITMALLAALPVYAHPPESIKMNFDIKKQTLKVDMEHDVKDITKHYINKVVIKVNGKDAITEEYKTQTNKKEQLDSYTLKGIKAGDEIAVTGYCSISGKKTEKLKISK